MRTVAIVRAFSMGLAAVGFFTACDKTPTPTPMAPSPAPTYRLVGRVVEADLHAGRVVGARVEVTTGVGVGLATYTDLIGTYRLDGVSGETGLRVTKNGYQPAARTIVVAGHRIGYDIQLPLLEPRADVSGIYTLTVSAADHCGVGLGEGHLPEEARGRSYQTVVRQDGAELTGTLSEVRFLGGIRGRVEPGVVVFDLPWWDGEQPYVAVQLPTSRFLVVDGTVAATGSANRLAGMLSGNFKVFETEDVWVPPIARCSSESHQFVLSR